MREAVKDDVGGPQALLDERAAAKFLGISPRVLWGLADSGVVPFIRIGPRLKRYDPRDLVNFIDANRRGKNARDGSDRRGGMQNPNRQNTQ